MEIVLIPVFILGLLVNDALSIVVDNGDPGLTTVQHPYNNTSPSVIPQHTARAVFGDDVMKGRIQPDCSNLKSLVCLDVKKKMSGYIDTDGQQRCSPQRATIQSCPTVEKVRLQVVSQGHFKKAHHTNPKVKTSGDRKALTITRPRIKQDVWISSSEGVTGGHSSPKLMWRYKAPAKWGNRTVWRKGTECLRRINSRNKRASKDDGYNVELNNLKHCGTKQSCIRFGAKTCRHLECEYLLTYQIVNHTVLHMEISGKTNGWVALGLSSDNKMGGDDVIVCKKRTIERDELVAAYMITKVAHAKPQPHNINDLNLQDTKTRDGYIYCKMTRQLRSGISSSNSKVDLTNNWFQFYARGDIDRNGGILKHSQIPPTSLETITMLRDTSIYSSTYSKLSNSAGSFYPHHPVGVALVLSVMGILFKVT